MKRNLLSILALLLMSATGAMAQTEELLTTITPTGTDTYSETTPGVVTVTHDNDDIYDEYGWVWWGKPGSVTVVANEGYTITKCVFRQYIKTPVTISSAPFEVSFIETHPFDFDPNYVKYLCEGTDPTEDMDGVSSIEVYGPSTSTGISDIKTTDDSTNGIYYDLQGRRIEKPTKGIYIVNGKKVVKK